MKTQMQITSLITYESIRAELPRREGQVYECFAKIGPANNRQVSIELGLDINQVTGRTNKLVNKRKRIYAYDKQIDLISGKPAIRWAIIPVSKQLEIY